jgi:Protein of unknown function (DUF3592)
MFNDLFDAFSYLWSWRWPVADGQVTAVDIERIGEGRNKTFRLAVAYEFSLGEDGPYTGESFWRPAFLAKTRVQNTARRFHRRQQVAIRYRPDDPSINRWIAAYGTKNRNSGQSPYAMLHLRFTVPL